MRHLQVVSVMLVALFALPAHGFDWRDGLPGGGDWIDLDPPTELPEDVCPIFPTLAQCTSVEWLQTECAEPYLSGARSDCERLIADAQAVEFAGVPDTPMMSHDTEEDVSGQEDEDFDESSIRFSGMEATYSGQVTGTRAGRNSRDGEAAGLGDALVRQWWGENCSVQSCEEYVYEKYYDLSSFEDFIGRFGDDYRAIFESAYVGEGIAWRQIRGYAAGSVGWIEPNGLRVRQNAFINDRPWVEEVNWIDVAIRRGFSNVSQEDAEAMSVTCSYSSELNEVSCPDSAPLALRRAATRMNDQLVAYPEDLYDALRDIPETYRPPPWEDAWEWHQEMSDVLSGYPDERLLWLEEIQDSVQSLSVQSVRVRQAINYDAQRIWEIDNDFSDTRPQTQLLLPEYEGRLQANVAQLRAIDAQLAAYRFIGEANGCFDTDTVTPCDWSPRWLAEDMFDFLQEERAADYQRCIEYTANNFENLYDPDPDDDDFLWLKDWVLREGDFCIDDDGDHIPGCFVQDSYIDHSVDIESYFTTLDVWAESLDFAVDPETREPIVGESASDSGDQGNSNFSVDFDYEFGWRFVNLSVPDICSLGLVASTGASLSATAFGLETELLGATVGVRANAAAPDADDDDLTTATTNTVRVLGTAIYTGETVYADRFSGGSYRFNVVREPNLTERVEHEKTYWLGWVPFTMQAGLAGTVGISFESAGGVEVCDPDAISADFSVEVTPYTNVGAYASLSVGVPGVSLGVRADLTIVDWRLPFVAALDLSLTEDEFVGGTTLDVETEFLRGSISLVAELLFDTYRKTLFSWRGVQWDTNLISRSLEFPLGVLSLFGGAEREAESPTLFADIGGTCRVREELPEPDYYFDFNAENVDGNTVSAQIGEETMTLVNGPTVGPGTYEQAIELDGDNDFARMQSGARDGSFTYSFWVRPRSADAGQLISLGGEDGVGGVGIDVREDGRISLRANCGTTNRGRLATQRVHTDQWNHFVISYAADGGHLRFYWKGIVVAYMSGCAVDLAGDDINFGRRVSDGTATAYLETAVDEFAYWPQRLQDSFVHELFSRGSGGRPVAGPGASPPQGVNDFRAESGGGSVLLRWTNPPSFETEGIGYEELMIRYSTERSPTSISEGEYLLTAEGGGGLFNHSEVELGETYYYSMFLRLPSFDWVRAGTTFTTARSELPPAVTNARLLEGPRSIQLSWRDPEVVNFKHTVVLRRSDGRAADGIFDGERIYIGRDEFIRDTYSLEPGTEYTYSIFALDYGYGFEPPVILSGTPFDAELDVTPPPPVSAFTAEPGSGEVNLSWTASGDTERVRISRQATGRFTTEVVYDGSATSYRDRTVSNGVQYRYSAIAYDGSSNASQAQVVWATPTEDGGLRAPGRFSATGTTDGVSLIWDRPTTGDVLIVRNDFSAPRDIRGGEVIYVGSDVGTLLDADTFPGQTWFYSAFTAVDGVFSAPVSASAERQAADVTPPAPVTTFAAELVSEAVLLSWVLPADADFDRVEVRVSTDEFPDFDSGTEVYSGPGTNALFLDTLPGTTYFFSAFAVDTTGNVSVAATAAATTDEVDVTPPGEVTVLTPTIGSTTISLLWSNPTDDDFQLTDVRMSSSAFPGPSEGTSVYSGIETSALAEGLTPGTTYYFSFFAYDTSSNASVSNASFTTESELDFPPERLVSLTREEVVGGVRFDWVLPAEDDLNRVELWWTPESNTTYGVGTLAYSGLGTSHTVSAPGGQRVFAQGWVFDDAGQRSSLRSTWGTALPEGLFVGDQEFDAFVGETFLLSPQWLSGPGVVAPGEFPVLEVTNPHAGIELNSNGTDDFMASFLAAGEYEVPLAISYGEFSDDATLTIRVEEYTGPTNEIDGHPLADVVLAGGYGASAMVVGEHLFVADYPEAGAQLRTILEADGSELASVSYSGTLLGTGTDTLYGRNLGDTFHVIDISTPTVPSSVEFTASSGGTSAHAFGGSNAAFLPFAGDEVLLASRVGDTLVETTPLDLGGRSAVNVALSEDGESLYVLLSSGADPAALRTYDVSTLGAPVLTDTDELPAGWNVGAINVSGPRLSLIVRPDFDLPALMVFNIADPLAPVSLGTPVGRIPEAIRHTVDGNSLWLQGAKGGPIVRYDLTDPTIPARSAVVGAPAGGAGDFVVAGDSIWVLGTWYPTPPESSGIWKFTDVEREPFFGWRSVAPATAGPIHASATGLVVGGASAIRVFGTDDPFSHPLVRTLSHGARDGNSLVDVTMVGDQVIALYETEVVLFSGTSAVDSASLELFGCNNAYVHGDVVVLGCPFSGVEMYRVDSALNSLGSAFMGAGSVAIDHANADAYALNDIGGVTRFDLAAADPFLSPTEIDLGLFTAGPGGSPMHVDGGILTLAANPALRWDLSVPAAPVALEELSVPHTEGSWVGDADVGLWAAYDAEGLSMYERGADGLTDEVFARMWMFPGDEDVAPTAMTARGGWIALDDADRDDATPNTAASMYARESFHRAADIHTRRPIGRQRYSVGGFSGVDEAGCIVTTGTCELSSNNGFTAVFYWNLVGETGEHEITLYSGDSSRYFVTRDRVRFE